MRVLVLGSAGQVGSALLARAPANMNVISSKRADCDATDSTAIRELLRHASPEVVINATAYTAVDKAESDQTTAMAVNADAVATLVAAHPGKLVHISTDFVFDGTATRPYRPDDMRNPLSAYGRSKAAGEDRLRSTDLLVRTAWVYAAGHANFVRTMLRLMRERGEVQVVSDQVGTPTWATSLAEAIWALVGQGRTGIWHYTDGGAASWYEFAVAIAEEALALGLLETPPTVVPITTAEYPTTARRPAWSVLDCSATTAALGYAPPSWRDNLQRMLVEEAKLG